MFDIIKKIFKNTPEEPTTIKQSELGDFIEENTKSDAIKDLVTPFKEEIDTVFVEIEKKCDVLDSAELHNKNIPNRAVHIMEGNRSAFIGKTKIIIKEIKDELSKLTSASFEDFFKKIEGLIDNYNKSTAKPYYVLQEFFGNESHQIAKSVKKLTQKLEGLKKNIEATDSFVYHQVKGVLKHIKNRKEKSDELKSQINLKQISINNSDKERKEDEVKIDNLKSSDEFSKYQKSINDLDKKKQDFVTIKSSVNQKILPLMRPLRKHSKIYMDSKVVDEIIKDPFHAIISIETDRISDMFGALLDYIQSDKIKLKDNVVEKYTKLLKGIDKDWIKKVKTDEKEIQEGISIVSNTIKTDATAGKLDDLNRNIKQFEQQIEFDKKGISLLEEDLKKITFTDLHSEIDSLLEKVDVIVNWN